MMASQISILYICLGKNLSLKQMNVQNHIEQKNIHNGGTRILNRGIASWASQFPFRCHCGGKADQSPTFKNQMPQKVDFWLLNPIRRNFTRRQENLLQFQLDKWLQDTAGAPQLYKIQPSLKLLNILAIYISKSITQPPSFSAASISGRIVG